MDEGAEEEEEVKGVGAGGAVGGENSGADFVGVYGEGHGEFGRGDDVVAEVGENRCALGEGEA